MFRIATEWRKTFRKVYGLAELSELQQNILHHSDSAQLYADALPSRSLSFFGLVLSFLPSVATANHQAPNKPPN
jgi:hypothetical protein